MAAKTNPDTPTPDWLRRLRDVRGCKREIARIFGEARTGSMDWADASKGANIVYIIARLVSDTEFEARLGRLEQALAEQTGRPIKPNGGSRHWSARP